MTGDESDIETIGCAQGGKVSVSVCASVVIYVRGMLSVCELCV